MSSLHQAPGGPGGEGGGYLHLALDLDTCTCCSPLASRWRLGGLGGWLQVCPGTNVLSSAADLKRSASPDCQSLRLDSLYLQEIPGEFETDGPQFRKKLQSNIIAKDCLCHDLSIDTFTFNIDLKLLTENAHSWNRQRHRPPQTYLHDLIVREEFQPFSMSLAAVSVSSSRLSMMNVSEFSTSSSSSESSLTASLSTDAEEDIGRVIH